MTPMMLMMTRPVARIKAVRAWEQPEFADRGELTKMAPKSIRDLNARGQYVYDKNGYVITTYDGLPDSEFETGTYDSTTGTYTGGGRYGNNQIDDVPWQPHIMDMMVMEDDVCYAFLGIKTNRPSAGNGGYELHARKHTPGHGCWTNLLWATTYVPYKPYREATGSNRIIDIHEANGACTVKMIDPVNGDVATVTATMLTDSDDLQNRPSVQTGNVAARHGTVSTTITAALKLAGSINEPIVESLKAGGPTSGAYDPTGIRVRWGDGTTWTVSSNSGYWATCHFYCTNYYGVEYSEGGELKLKATPVYDYLTKQAGFMDEASDSNRLIFSQGKRPFLPIFDDGFVIEEESA